MPEKKRNYDADTISISGLSLRKKQTDNSASCGDGFPQKGSSGRAIRGRSVITIELVQRIIEKVKDA